MDKDEMSRGFGVLECEDRNGPTVAMACSFLRRPEDTRKNYLRTAGVRVAYDKLVVSYQNYGAWGFLFVMGMAGAMLGSGFCALIGLGSSKWAFGVAVVLGYTVGYEVAKAIRDPEKIHRVVVIPSQSVMHVDRKRRVVSVLVTSGQWLSIRVVEFNKQISGPDEFLDALMALPWQECHERKLWKFSRGTQLILKILLGIFLACVILLAAGWWALQRFGPSAR